MNELAWVTMEREKQENRPDRKLYQITAKGQEALPNWQTQPTDVLQLRDELLLKLLFGTFAPPGALAANVRASIAYHEQRLLQYRTNMQFLPVRKGSLHANTGMKRPNPYAPQNEEDPYVTLIARFAVAFEETYLRWLYETLDVVEGRKGQSL